MIESPDNGQKCGNKLLIIDHAGLFLHHLEKGLVECDQTLLQEGDIIGLHNGWSEKEKLTQLFRGSFRNVICGIYRSDTEPVGLDFANWIKSIDNKNTMNVIFWSMLRGCSNYNSIGCDNVDGELANSGFEAKRYCKKPTTIDEMIEILKKFFPDLLKKKVD